MIQAGARWDRAHFSNGKTQMARPEASHWFGARWRSAVMRCEDRANPVHRPAQLECR